MIRAGPPRRLSVAQRTDEHTAGPLGRGGVPLPPAPPRGPLRGRRVSGTFDDTAPNYERPETEIQIALRSKDVAQDLPLPGADRWLAHTRRRAAAPTPRLDPRGCAEPVRRISRFASPGR
jgi:hypothetical protein